MKNYLVCDGFQYVQIDDKKSLLEHLHFGVPPGVNFGLVILLICGITSVTPFRVINTLMILRK